MKRLFSDNWIIAVIGVSFIVSIGLAIRNNFTIQNNHVVQAQTDLIIQETQDILTSTMHGLDLGVRGFGLTHDERLLIPYNGAIELTPETFRRLDSLLAEQQYPDRNKLSEVKAAIDGYVHFSNEMIEHARNNEMEIFNSKLAEDRGYDVWSKYSEFSTPLLAYQEKLKQEALSEYTTAIQSNLIIQIVILILVMPMLYIFVTKVKQARKNREALLNEVDRTDRMFVFNNGIETETISEEINKRSIEHVKRASDFIASIASGVYDVEWQGLSAENAPLNKNTLAGNLINLRERLKTVKIEDEKRNWSNEGLAQFSEIVRKHQHDKEELPIKCISFLTKYIQAQQGSLFIVEGEGKEAYLNLAGCYAFDRRKWLQKRVEIGVGLVGQVFLEGESVMLKEVPAGYTTITSGLGDSTPSCIAIIPMKYEGTCVAISEFATFNELQNYQVVFLEKAGEFLASALINARNTLRMKQLLHEASERESIMQQREEELRQNMEELQATQEELVRNQRNFKLQVN